MSNQRERTFKMMNLGEFNPDLAVGRYQMPIILPSKHIPKELLSFNQMLSSKETKKGVHFFIDDYQFERLWREPERYLDRLSEFDCVLTPDFSLYRDMPIAMQIWNVYRSRLLGQIMQKFGITVIPTLQWCEKGSFDFCFDGLSEGGTVAVSTVGLGRNPEATQLWKEGMDEAIRRLKPNHIIHYGKDIGYKYDCKASFIKATSIAGKEEFHNGKQR